MATNTPTRETGKSTVATKLKDMDSTERKVRANEKKFANSFIIELFGMCNDHHMVMTYDDYNIDMLLRIVREMDHDNMCRFAVGHLIEKVRVSGVDAMTQQVNAQRTKKETPPKAKKEKKTNNKNNKNNKKVVVKVKKPKAETKANVKQNAEEQNAEEQNAEEEDAEEQNAEEQNAEEEDAEEEDAEEEDAEEEDAEEEDAEEEDAEEEDAEEEDADSVKTKTLEK